MKIKLRGGHYKLDSRFVTLLTDHLSTRKEGLIFNEYDNCIIQAEDIEEYEDSSGKMIKVKITGT
jgi:hypothetical protein